MRPVFENGAPVPAFLNKLWKMVDDEKTDNLISWSPGGQSFIIKHQGDFCTKLLPQFYKHSNMASFVRQLNMYGFHKVSNIENGIHKGEREEIEFIHLYFKKGEPTLVEKIKRKMSSRIPNNNSDSKNMEMMTKVLKDVAQMRGRQLSLDAQLATMKQHNVALWRELSLLRRKHHKQQQIVNKLIQFLVSLVQPSRNNLNGLGVKRRYPLMINDIAQNNGTKAKKISRTSESPGPTIHELDTTDNTLLEEAGMLEDYIEPVIELHNSPESHRSSYNSSNSKNASPILLDFDDTNDGSNDEECPLSPDLLFATNPHLVTPAPQTMQQTQQQKKQTKSKSKAKNIKKSEQAESTELLNDLTENSTIIDAIIQPENATENNGVQTIMVSSGDANILKAAAQEFGFIISNDENSQHGETITLENGSQMDLNELLQSSEVVNPIKCEPIETVLNDSSKTMCTVEPSTSTSPTVTDEDVQIPTENLVDADELLNNRAIATVQLPEVTQLNTASDLDNHLDSMQTELDSLKDLLVGEGYSIDANALLGLFGSDDPMSYTLPLSTNDYENQELSQNEQRNSQSNSSRQNNSDPILSGSELMCAPTFDFDMFSTPDNTIMATPENSMDPSDIKNFRYNDNLTNNCDSPLTPNFILDYEK